MAILYADGSAWGEVVTSKFDDNYPCFDTNYLVRKLSFTIDKTFASFQAFITFEATTIKSYFSDREYNLSYGSNTFTGYVLTSFSRVDKISAAVASVTASYIVTFVKDGA